MKYKNEMERQLNASENLIFDVTNFVVFNQIAGDYLEFGVYLGNSMIQTDSWMKVHWKEYLGIEVTQNIKINLDTNFISDKRYFAFDSFKGLPYSSSPETPLHFREGAYNSSLESFKNNLEKNSFDLSKMIPIAGWYNDTLNHELKLRHKLSKASIIFIDCDLYESAVPVFNFITDLIHDGTVLIIDDFFRYKGHPDRGIQGVYNRWIKENPYIHTAELARCCANRIAFVCNRI